MNRTRLQNRPLTWAVVLCTALLTACSSSDDARDPASARTAAAGQSPAAATTAPSAPDATEPAAGDTPAAPGSDEGPEGAFRTWLTASRSADAATACAYLTPALAQRMVDELAAGLPGISDCASMVEFTAGLYAAVGQSAEVEVELVEQTDEHAVLDVTYASGDCGTVVLVPGTGHWVLDERSEEQC
ncbi:hypothetical protein [Cellulomonas persica]|uniref:Lipoprotein n=1 Tax=Cellulomonas persica TaxID=76861 RepID=A0A510UPL2_9CELL|nr:hypothetical protein [Cellulomonas persica]GEK16602.1 hypothetical protein CPE01_03350 [Cellulomonas persica]